MAHRAGALLWLLLSHRYPSLKVGKTWSQLKNGETVYKSRLEGLGTIPGCMSYDRLTLNGFLREKHWKYAVYMATLSSLPVLHRTCNANEISSAIMGKTSLGASAKLLDNLNDEIHSVESAIQSLQSYERAMTEGEIEAQLEADPRLSSAETSAFEIAGWTGRVVRDVVNENYKSFQLYLSDVRKLVRGQIDSLLHKSGRAKLPTIREYLASISEKSIGDVWVDLDLCMLEHGLGSIDDDLYRALQLLKVGNGFAFKSSLVYDDAQDLITDLQTNSINSCVILGIERGAISERDLSAKPPELLAKQLERSGIVSDTIALADLIFLAGIKLIQEAATSGNGIVDWRGLLLSYRFVRLFNLRKMLSRNRDYETGRLFLASLEKFEHLEEEIPEHIYALQRHLA